MPPERDPAGTTPAGQPGGVIIPEGDMPPERASSPKGDPAGTTPAGQPTGAGPAS